MTRVPIALRVGLLGLASCGALVGIHEHELASDAGAGSPDGAHRDASSKEGDVVTDVSTIRDAGVDAASSLSDADFAACRAMAAADCNRIASCTSSGLSTYYGDSGVCNERFESNCLGALAEPHTANTAATVAACANSVPLQDCSSYLSDNSTDACSPPRGSLLVGSPCTASSQCDTAFCAVPTSSACGTCEAPPTEDAPCIIQENCGTNMHCFHQRCVSYRQEGDACNSQQPCAAGLACLLEAADAGAGTCVAEGTMVDAGPCNAKSVIVVGCNLDRGVSCDEDKATPGFRTCQPVTLAAPGEPCGTQNNGAYDICTNNSTCFRVASADGGGADICIPNAKDNAPCNTALGPDCERPARCIGNALDGGTVVGICTFPYSTHCP